ncbi:MAG: helix-turn-helix transcriptional regulator [Actinobacteria bacterium]|nr:helix-turn-helix transcriptional regulator [Actinomycetota bacterium]
MSGSFPIGRSALVALLDGCLGLIGRGRDLIDGGADRVAGLAAEDRARVVDSLEGDLDCLVDDAASRGITERAAEELLLTAAVLDWLRGGGLPGRGAVEFMEDRVAAMNGARHEGEVELRDALRAVLEALVRNLQKDMAAGRWLGRDLNQEAALRRRLRAFGGRLEATRRSRGLTVGELADEADMDVVNIVAYILGAEEPAADVLSALAEALSVGAGDLLPPGPPPSGGPVDGRMIGGLPREADGDATIDMAAEEDRR